MSVKLTIAQRTEIRESYRRGQVTQSVLAQAHGVSQQTISNVLNPEKALQKARAYRKAHPAACRMAERKWLASNKTTHAIADRRWQQANPEKNRAKARAYAARHPERRRENLRLWYANNPERAHELASGRRARERGASGVGYSLHEWQQVCAIWGGCAYCEVSGPLTVDHIQPLASNGNNEPANLAPCCRSCNSSKHISDLAEWRNGAHVWVKAFAQEIAIALGVVL